MRRIIREPLVHFLIGGLLVFLLFALRGDAGDVDRDIAVSSEVEAGLVDQWTKAQGRPPTAQERNKLIEQWVRDEVLYREALRLGLDRDDVVIKRRLANKMEFYLENTIPDAQPSREDLERWLAANPDRYRVGRRIDFRQLWFAGEGDARDALRKLESGADWATLGGEISLPGTLENQDTEQVLKRFGDRFARALASLEADDAWHGPIASSFGYHLVKVSRISPGRLPSLDEVREDVAEDWRRADRTRQLDSAYADYRDRYDVVLPK